MDTWENTNSALRCANRALKELHRIEPPVIKKGATAVEIAERQSWEAELKELRAWYVSIHERRIRLCVQGTKQAKLHFLKETP